MPFQLWAQRHIPFTSFRPHNGLPSLSKESKRVYAALAILHQTTRRAMRYLNWEERSYASKIIPNLDSLVEACSEDHGMYLISRIRRLKVSSSIDPIFFLQPQQAIRCSHLFHPYFISAVSTVFQHAFAPFSMGF